MIAGVVLALPFGLAAQTLTGAVVDDRTGAPLTGVLVSLQGLDGARVSAALTDAAGRFSFRAVPGRYRLQAERIGLATHRTDWIDWPHGDGLQVIPMSSEALRLAGLVVDTRIRECQVDPVTAVQVQRWWDEARKALDGARVVEQASGVRFRVSRFEREWSADLRSLFRESASRSVSYAARPFASLSADSLAERGYVQGSAGERQFFAPDAEVLLSSSFLSTHCFSLEEDSERPHWIGLRFQPTRRLRTVDILGVLWVDTLTARLRTLDFRYANLPDDLPGDEAGGRVEFEQLPNGAWMVSEWWVRMPRVGVRRGQRSSGTRDVHLVAGYVDTGGTVHGIDGGGGFAGDRPVGYATIEGVVTDSLTGRPLAGAQVVVTGTALMASTRDDGTFSIPDVPAGERGLTVFHPDHSALGIASPVHTLQVPSAGTVQSSLATPGFRGVALALCSSATDAETLLVGRIATSDGSPVGDALLRATWRERALGAANTHNVWAEAYADSDGRYVLCDLPHGTPIEIQLRRADAWLGVGEVSLVPLRVHYRESVVAKPNER